MKKKRFKMNWYEIGILICSAAIPFLSYFNTLATNKENEILNEKLLKYTKKSSDNTSKIVSSDTYPLAQISNYSKDLDTVILSLQALGINSIKNIEIYQESLVNYREVSYPFEVLAFGLPSTRKDIKVELKRLRGGSGGETLKIEITDKDLLIILRYLTDFGNYSQFIFLTKENEQFANFTFLIDDSKTIIYKSGSKNYPEDKNGYLILTKGIKYKRDVKEGSELTTLQR